MSPVANILDPVQSHLDPTVFDNAGSPDPVLKPRLEHWIKTLVYTTLDHHGYTNPERWLKLFLTGSLTTYQYSEDSDVDVSLFVGPQLPEWSRAEMIGVMVENTDGKKLPGTAHVMQCYVVPAGIAPADLYRPGLRSAFSLDNDEWVVPPERDRAHSVEAQENGFYMWSLEQADKMERLLKYEPDKAKQFWHAIHRRRKEDMAQGKGDYSESNILYKFLNQRGLLPEIEHLTGEHIAAYLPECPMCQEPGSFVHPGSSNGVCRDCQTKIDRGLVPGAIPNQDLRAHEQDDQAYLKQYWKDQGQMQQIPNWGDMRTRSSGIPRHNLQWQPGGPGKGFIITDGSVWTWPTENMEPTHGLMNAHAKAEDLQVKPSSAFHIEPHGRLWQYNSPDTIPGTGRRFEPEDRFNIQKANAGLWFGQPGDEPPAVDDGYGHATRLVASAWDMPQKAWNWLDPRQTIQQNPGMFNPEVAQQSVNDSIQDQRSEQAQAMLDQNAGQDIQGLPGPVNVPGYGSLQFRSNADIQRVANEYNQANGLGAHPTNYLPVNPETGAQIANEYDAMPHNPQDPNVQQAYHALANESMAQYQHALKNGYRFEFYPEDGIDPYPNSPREAVMDLHHNKHMYVYPTETGYGSGEDTADHPLLQDSGERWNGRPVTHNDIFRAIHDFYGHAKEGVGFRSHGEDNAYRQHAAMFSPAAQQALASETRGQNSWVNFGPHGQTNQTANQGETVYAPQKAGLLPEWVSNPDLHAQGTVAKTAASQIATDAVEAVFAHGGTTVGLDGSTPTTGYALSPSKSEEKIIPSRELTPDAVEEYMDEHYEELAHGYYLGIWVSGDDAYLDLSIVSQDLDQAMQMAEASNQLAIYDLSSGQEIPVTQPAVA